MKTNYKIICSMTAALLCCTGIPAIAANAADGLVYHADGTASYYENGTALTGGFCISPDYLSGDVTGDALVGSTDAAAILTAAASSGAGNMTTAELLAGTGTFLPDAETAAQYADVNQDGMINASDAAMILDHAAAYGTNAEIPPLGSVLYYADAEGILCTGWLTADSGVMYANADFSLHTGWLTLDGGQYYFDRMGIMLTGWQNIGANRYHFGTDGRMDTGLVTMTDGTYYFGDDGILKTGVQVIDGQMYCFGADGKPCTGWNVINGVTYYFGETGAAHTGWLETDDGDYYFEEDGTMVTGFTDLGSGMVYFEPDGRYYGKCTDITDEKTAILENAALEPHESYIIWNRQVSPETQYTKITLKEKDIAILEEFANTYFTEDMTMAQKLWITQQWIHKKVDYAYAGEKWNSIVNLSYVEAIFVNRMGQCVQYNGAMAAMMIWFGYDVYMVKGWTDTGNQHFWTEVVIDGTTYLMECGNYGKNGNWHDFLTPIG